MAHDALGARSHVESGRGGLLVGEELNESRTTGDPRHAPDEPVPGHDRVVEPDPVLGARCDDDRLREGAGRAADHLGQDRVEVVGEARAVDVLVQAPQVLVLLERELALDHALPELAVLLLQPLGLGPRLEQAVGPAVRVPERLRDAFEADRERTEDARARVLHAGERPVVLAAKRERDQDERRKHETAQREAAAERTCAA
jgi:hypothetical protein